MTFHEMTMQQRVKAYLMRINFEAEPRNDVETLAILQERHVSTVPYENFDILRGKPLSYEIADLYDKIVTRHRGGYCFELNGLYGWLLRELNYPVTDLFSRFLRDEPAIPKRRHRVLRVEADGEAWLADVGVGGMIPRRPLLLKEGLVQTQGEECYRLLKDATLGWVVQEMRHGVWSAYYSFSEEPQLPVDFDAISFFCEKSPHSPFNKKPMAAIQTADGRVTLDGDTFKVFSAEGVQVFAAKDKAEFDRLLQKYFGITVE